MKAHDASRAAATAPRAAAASHDDGPSSPAAEQTAAPGPWSGAGPGNGPGPFSRLGVSGMFGG